MTAQHPLDRLAKFVAAPSRRAVLRAIVAASGGLLAAPVVTRARQAADQQGQEDERTHAGDDGSPLVELAPSPASGSLIAYLQDHNVWLMNSDGTDKRQLTADGMDPDDSSSPAPRIAYPWHGWSPDGRRLLVWRRVTDEADRVQAELIAFDPTTGAAGENFGPVDYVVPVGSPSGRYLAVVRPGPDGEGVTPDSDLELLDLAGGSSRFVKRNEEIVLVGWASERDQLLVGTLVPGDDCGVCSRTVSVGRLEPNGELTEALTFETQMGCGGGWPWLLDPAWEAYIDEIDYHQDAFPALQWPGDDLAVIGTPTWCGPGQALVCDLATRSADRPSDFFRALLSSTGALAVLIDLGNMFQGMPPTLGVAQVAAPGDVTWLGEGEQPAWSPDGQVLYFVRRQQTGGETLVEAGTTDEAPLLYFATSVWRVDAGGANPTRIAELDAYGFGPLQVAPDGRSLVFVAIDNATDLWANRLPGDAYDDALLERHRPEVRVERLDLASGRVTTLARRARAPRLQPAASGTLLDAPTGPAAQAPKIIGGPEAEMIADGAEITWTTDVPATSVVEYGPSEAYGQQAEDDAPVTDHRVVLAGLVPGATYHYRVRSVAAGATVSGDDRSFTVSGGYAVTDLGALPDFPSSQATGLNNVGQVVGTCYREAMAAADTNWCGFIWTAGRLTDLGALAEGAELVRPAAINDNGWVAGNEWASDSPSRAILLRDGQMIDLGALPEDNNVFASDINAAGQIVGTSGLFSFGLLAGEYRPPFAFRYAEDRMVDLGTVAGGVGSSAYGINDRGQIVGSVTLADGTEHAASYENGTWADLGTLPGYLAGRAVTVNEGGVIVGYAMREPHGAGDDRAFAVLDGEMTDLGALPGGETSQARDVNRLGYVVGTSGPFQAQRAFLFAGGAMLDLNDLIPADSGWVLTEAVAINDRGWIVGSGSHGGESHAFLLTPTGADGDPAAADPDPAPDEGADAAPVAEEDEAEPPATVPDDDAGAAEDGAVAVDEAPAADPAEAAAEAAREISRLEAAYAFDALYDLLHPDAQAIVPREVVVGWYADFLAGRQVEELTVTAVRLVAWTWPVTGVTYDETAEVDYVQPVWEGGVRSEWVETVRLVEAGGTWRWFFGRSREFVEEQIAKYGQ